ncbi:sulfotransferase, partial [Candidatus Pacearchaeota archaeon]|nr:sulfotransferase [Candidatus Pacearchaeota archaeon]
LFYYLEQHPKIYFPEVKELNFFCNHRTRKNLFMGYGTGPGDRHATFWTESLEEYRSHFKRCSAGQLAGEASVSYLYSPSAPTEIASLLPEIKLIVILRHPVDRAWSHYLQLVRDGRETLSFSEALDAEKDRLKKGWEFAWHYRNMGLYAEQLSRFYKLFPKENIRVHLFEDFKQNPFGITCSIFNFFGLDTRNDIRSDVSHNVSGELKNKFLARLLNRPSVLRSAVKYIVPRRLGHHVMEYIRGKNLKPGNPQMPLDIRHQLDEFYAEDIKRTAQLIGRDLSHWLRN